MISRSVEGENATFPEVTICNLQAQTTPYVDLVDYGIASNVLNETVVSNKFKTYMDDNFPTIRYNRVLDLPDDILYWHEDPFIFSFYNFLQRNYSFSSEDSPIIDCNFVDCDYNVNDNSNCLSNVNLI